MARIFLIPEKDPREHPKLHPCLQCTDIFIFKRSFEYEEVIIYMCCEYVSVSVDGAGVLCGSRQYLALSLPLPTEWGRYERDGHLRFIVFDVSI
jgi:hypothetical protein